jgi:hypothetical protein
MVRPCLSLALRANPLYTVTHDAVSNEVTVTMGEHLLIKSPIPTATIDMNGFVSATVAAQRPKEVRLRGKATVRVRTSGGAHVVRAEIELTDESAMIAGTVAVDGEELVSRRWTV